MILLDVLVWLAVAKIAVMILEDGAYAARGKQSPRRQERARRQAGEATEAKAAGKDRKASGSPAPARPGTVGGAVSGYVAGLIEDATANARARRRRELARRRGAQAVDGVFVDVDKDSYFYADCDVCGWASRRYRIEANALGAGREHTRTEHPDQYSGEDKEATQNTNNQQQSDPDGTTEAPRPKLTLLRGGAEDPDATTAEAAVRPADRRPEPPAPLAPAAAAPATQAAGPVSSVVHSDDHTYCLAPGCPVCRPARYGWNCIRCGGGRADYRTEAEARADGEQHTCPTRPADQRERHFTRCTKCGYVWASGGWPFSCRLCFADGEHLEPATVQEYDAWTAEDLITDDPARRERGHQLAEVDRVRVRSELFGLCGYREVGPGSEEVWCDNPAGHNGFCATHKELGPDSTTSTTSTTTVRTTEKENNVNFEAAGPDVIRTAFTDAAQTASDKADELGGIAGVLGDAADQYEADKMAASTLEHLREASESFASAQASLNSAQEHLEAALADFNAHDGAVADTIAETGGNVASEQILVG